MDMYCGITCTCSACRINQLFSIKTKGLFLNINLHLETDLFLDQIDIHNLKKKIPSAFKVLTLIAFGPTIYSTSVPGPASP